MKNNTEASLVTRWEGGLGINTVKTSSYSWLLDTIQDKITS